MASNATIGNLRVLLTLDSAQFDKAVKSADASTQKLANTMKRDLEPSQTRINKLVREFAGSKEIGNALAYAKAMDQLATGVKLTTKHQEDANRAAMKAIEVYRSMGQAVPPEINRLAVATANVTKTTENMAAATSKAAQSSGLLGMSFARLTSAFTAASLIDKVIGGLTQSVGMLVSSGLQLDGVERGFTNLARSAKLNGADMISAMQQGTRGLVANVDLFQSANKAMLLGLPVTVQSMKEMSTAATALGRAMGQDATKSLDDMITALGRVSPLILDNLGLTVKVEEANKKYAASIGKAVDELDEAEKKIAFYNAAMEAARKKTAELGEQQLTLADQVSRAWVAVTNAVGSAVSGLNKILGVGIDQLIIDLKYIASLVNPLSFKGAKTLEQTMRERDAAANRASFAGHINGDVQEVGAPSGLFGFIPGQSQTQKLTDYSAELAKTRRELSGLSVETKKQIIAGLEMGKSVKDISTSLKVSEAAIAMYRDSIKGSTSDAKRAAEDLREAVEKMTGKQIREDLKEFEKRFAMAISAGGIDKSELEATHKAIETFVNAGLQIDPAMQKWYSDHALTHIVESNFTLQESFFNTAKSIEDLVRIARGGASQIATGAYSIMKPFGSLGQFVKPTDWGGLMSGGMSVANLMGQTNTKGQSLSKLFGGGVMDFTGDMSSKIMRAITGGGDIGKTLGSLFGTDVLGKMTGKMGESGLFDQGIGKMLQGSFLGKKIGGFIGSMIPGLGALLGPAMSAIIGKISGIGKNNTLKDRQGFAQQQGFGDLNAMLDALATSGPGGKALADMAARGIGKGDNEANRKWMADVQKFFEQQAKTTAAVSESIGKAQSALERFGGAAPKSLRPLIDNLLKSTQLTKDQRTALEGMAQTPSWQTIQQRAEALGIDFGALGGTFNQKRIADAGFGFQHDIEMFLENGADRDGVLRGMADELSELAAEAVRTGRALPKTLEMYIRRLQEMGLLVDEQGNAIAEGLMFQDMVDESLQKVVGVLEEIRDLLAGANQPPPVVSPPRIGDWNNGDGKSGEPGFRFGDADFGDGPDFNLPGFAGGTRGAYQDFGAGTPVMLHGKERVMTEAEGRMSSGMMTVIVEADGRQLSRIVAPFVPGEVRRLGLGRN